MERSRYETGPPGGYDDGQKFNDDVEEAIRLSLVDSVSRFVMNQYEPSNMPCFQGIPPDPDVVYFDESMPQGSITGNACDSNDAELILNAEVSLAHYSSFYQVRRTRITLPYSFIICRMVTWSRRFVSVASSIIWVPGRVQVIVYTKLVLLSPNLEIFRPLHGGRA